jgi:hypothetical protein
LIRVTVACLAAVVLVAEPAASHVIISSHTTRHGSGSIKLGPCGKLQSERGGVIHIFEPGETIHLEWDEFISHPGYFRISFDEDGDDDFVDPANYNDFYTNDSVLVDELFPHARPFNTSTYEFDLTLPNVECENCTIQLIQMMTDKPPYAVGTNDIYYNCLDVTLIPDPVVNAFCDFNGDSLCDGADINLLMNEAATGGIETDLTSDGIVNNDDRDKWLALAGPENGFAEPLLVGDSNTDGIVNANDLNALALSWQSPQVFNWTDGNYTVGGSPGINVADLNALALNWRESSVIAAASNVVPEPNGFGLLLLASMLMCRRRIFRTSFWQPYCSV